MELCGFLNYSPQEKRYPEQDFPNHLVQTFQLMYFLRMCFASSGSVKTGAVATGDQGSHAPPTFWLRDVPFFMKAQFYRKLFINHCKNQLYLAS